VDRADIKQYIGNPGLGARYTILQSCLTELMRVQIISPPESLLDITTLAIMSTRPSFQNTTTPSPSFQLYEIAKMCDNLSGRTLRKLPFLAHAKYIKAQKSSACDFLYALQKSVIQYLKNQEAMSKQT